MKLLLISLSFLLMIGCSAQVDSTAWDQAEEQCALNGGIDLIFARMISNDMLIICENGFHKETPRIIVNE